MNNFIEYYYGIKTDKVSFNNKFYSFAYNGYNYRLYICDENINTEFLYNINKYLLNITLISEIIFNKNNEIISHYNGIDYVLIKLFINPHKNISLDEISFLSNFLYGEELNINWAILWSKKIDYLENLINENGIKHPLIVDSFNYFVGMTENAISYFNAIDENDDYKYSISHKKINCNDNIDVLYNPLNIIFDYRVRDVAEYIKNSFFINNYNIFNELSIYLKNTHLSRKEAKILVSRLLYPSFYFDMYEDVLIDNKEEKIILNIISKLDEYEAYLSKIIEIFVTYYSVSNIDWLKKRRT